MFCIKINSRLVLLLFCLIGCSKKTEIVGTYGSNKQSEIQQTLEIGQDSTYRSYNFPFSGEIMFESYGKWEIKNDTLILLEGINFTDFLELTLTDSISVSDSLYIQLDKNVIETLPQISLRLDIDSLVFVPDKTGLITINRSIYQQDEKILPNTPYHEMSYRLIFQSKEFYAILNECFGYGKIALHF